MYTNLKNSNANIVNFLALQPAAVQRIVKI